MGLMLNINTKTLFSMFFVMASIPIKAFVAFGFNNMSQFNKAATLAIGAFMWWFNSLNELNDKFKYVINNLFNNFFNHIFSTLSCFFRFDFNYRGKRWQSQ